MRTNDELLASMERSLEKVDRLMTTLVKDPRFQIGKGGSQELRDQLHDAIGALGHVGSGLHLFRKRLGKS